MGSMQRFIGPRAVLGESPVWDYRTDHLYWVDIEGRSVHRWAWASGRTETRRLVSRPGSIGLTRNPERILVASEHGVGLLTWASGSVDWIVALPNRYPSVRLNDGRVSRDGHFWVGSMHEPAGDERFIGSIYRVFPDWTWEEVISDVGIANGLVSTPVGMHWADTLRRSCWVHSDATSATPATPRAPHVDFSELGLPGGPDGACIDSRENVWLACVNGSTLAAFDLDGRLLERVQVPVRRPTCIAFGGPDLRTAFVTSIGGGNSYPTYADEPDAGRVLVLDLGREGTPEYLFAADGV